MQRVSRDPPSLLAQLADYYRLRHGVKISTLRLVLYVLFGYAASGTFHIGLSTLNLLMTTGWLLFASVLNDYYDYRLLGEQNALGIAIASGQLSLWQLRLLATIPAALSLGLYGMLWVSPVTRFALFVWGLVIVLGILYSLPPIRLKQRPILNILTTPLALFSLFLESFTLLRLPDRWGWWVAGLVFLFAWYLECLHLVDDSLQPHEFKKLGTSQAMAWLRRVGVIGLLGSVGAALSSPLLMLSTATWGLRLLALRRLQPAEIPVARRHLLHPIWRLEDFAVYGLVGLAQILR